MLEEYLKSDISMNERTTLTSDLKQLSLQPVGPWQAGAGGYLKENKHVCQRPIFGVYCLDRCPPESAHVER